MTIELLTPSVMLLVTVVALVSAVVGGLVQSCRSNKKIRDNNYARIMRNAEILREAIMALSKRPRNARMELKTRKNPENGMFAVSVYWRHDPQQPTTLDSLMIKIEIDTLTGEVWLDDRKCTDINALSSGDPWNGFIKDVEHQLELFRPVRRIG